MKKCFAIRTMIVLFLIVWNVNTAEADAISDALKVRDFATVLRLSLVTAEAGDMRVQHNVCVFYMQGVGTDPNEDKAIYWCKKAALQGNGGSKAALGDLYKFFKKDYKEAYRWYSAAAEQGIYNGQMGLAYMHLNGESVPQDVVVSASWFLKAASQNDPSIGEPLVRLAVLYMTGIGVAKDYGLAVKYAQKSADLGYPEGLYVLGYAYLNGFGVPVDKAKAKEWLKKAAAAGYPDAPALLKGL